MMAVLLAVLVLAALPAAPAEVRAADTPNDDGGSITVIWMLSVDDVALSAYEVVRVAADGTEEVVAQLPAGVSRFIDDGVPDGRPFR